MAKTLKDAKQELIYVRDKLYDSLSTAEENGKQKGKKEERETMYSIYQNNGNAQNYCYAFAFGRFIDGENGNYNPQHDIRATSGSGGTYIYYNSPITDTKVPVYTSNNSNGMCQGANKLKTFHKLVSQENTTYSAAFDHCTSLEHIRVEGVIGKSINFSYCPLDLESAKSVLLHLKRFPEYEGSTESPYSVLLSDYTWGLLDVEGSEAPDAGYMSWRTYVTLQGWSY